MKINWYAIALLLIVLLIIAAVACAPARAATDTAITEDNLVWEHGYAEVYQINWGGRLCLVGYTEGQTMYSLTTSIDIECP